MKTKIDLKSPEWSAALAALISGIAAHAYALVNTLHNYDNILQQPKGYGAGITSGRWLLSALGDFNAAVFDLNYNLPVINGLAYLLLIALSTAFVVNLLKIHNRVSSILAGCMMATFPAVCATMVFRYTTVYYGLSLLLSVLAVWVVCKPKYGLLASALCTACSLGIYQAYTPVTIGLFVLILLRDSLDEDADLVKLIRRGLWYCASLILGVLLYFVLLKVFLAIYSIGGEVVLDSYQGINDMGKLSLSELPYLLKKAWTSAAFFSVKDYCNLASTRILKILWTLLILVILVLAAYLLIRKKVKPLLAAFCCLMGLLFPLAINFQVIMCPQGTVYTIMVYSFVLVACAPLMLLELLPETKQENKPKFSWVIGVLLAGIVFYNSYYTNYNYTTLYYANRQVENYLSGLVAQMRMTEDYTPDKKWVFLGSIQDPLFYDIWDVMPLYGGLTGTSAKGLLNASYSFDFWIYSYIGYGTPYASEEEEAAISQDPRVEEMPCWPAEGSIQVIDDLLVVKFQDTTP